MQPLTHSVGTDGGSLLHHFQFGGEAGHWGSQLFYQSIFQLHFFLQGGQLLIHAVQETLKLRRMEAWKWNECNHEFIILNCLFAGTAERWVTNLWSAILQYENTHEMTILTELNQAPLLCLIIWTEGIISIASYWLGNWIYSFVPLPHFLVSLHTVHAIGIR